MSINGLLNTSKDSLLSYQLAIDLTGSNIANVSTPGYSRQRPVFQSLGSVDVGSKRAQIGVDVTSIERIYDKYVDSQVVEQARMVGYGEANSDVLNSVEGIFAEETGGVTDLLNKFWNSWTELSANPQGRVERENLLAAAENMASTFRRLDGDLIKIEQDASGAVSNTIVQINAYLSQIADLNNKISSYASDKGEANILRDSRSELLNKLANLIDMNYLEDSNGAVNIFLANGLPLLTHDNVMQLKETMNSENVVEDIVYSDNTSKSLKDVISEGKRGKLAAFYKIGESIVPAYRDELDNIANALVAEVNAAHQQGFDNNGDRGGIFFEETAGAKSMRVSAAVTADINKISASSTVNGDGNNARSIYAIKDRNIMSSNTSTINDYYASFVGRVGRDVADAKNGLDHQKAIMEQLIDRRESVSGVSLDEEMVDLIKYQMAYNAAGKLVSTVNEIMETLINLGK